MEVQSAELADYANAELSKETFLKVDFEGVTGLSAIFASGEASRWPTSRYSSSSPKLKNCQFRRYCSIKEIFEYTWHSVLSSLAPLRNSELAVVLEVVL